MSLALTDGLVTDCQISGKNRDHPRREQSDGGAVSQFRTSERERAGFLSAWLHSAPGRGAGYRSLSTSLQHRERRLTISGGRLVKSDSPVGVGVCVCACGRVVVRVWGCGCERARSVFSLIEIDKGKSL